jgi:hypothetical protein
MLQNCFPESSHPLLYGSGCGHFVGLVTFVLSTPDSVESNTGFLVSVSRGVGKTILRLFPRKAADL